MIFRAEFPDMESMQYLTIFDNTVTAFKLFNSKNEFEIKSGSLKGFIGIKSPNSIPSDFSDDSISFIESLKCKALKTDDTSEIKFKLNSMYSARIYQYKTLGVKYLYYFNALGGFLGNGVPYSLQIKSGLLYRKLLPSLNRLINPKHYGNSIPINEKLRDDIKALLLQFRKLSEEPEYHALIDDIISDVEYFTGKTINEIGKFGK
jgi:hypothetical protein